MMRSTDGTLLAPLLVLKDLLTLFTDKLFIGIAHLAMADPENLQFSNSYIFAGGNEFLPMYNICFQAGRVRHRGNHRAKWDFPLLRYIRTYAKVSSAKSRTGFNGQDYELVCSDEFNTDGRSFYPGDDPYREAVDLWYEDTGEVEWYDPGQITTKDGKLSVLIENVESLWPVSHDSSLLYLSLEAAESRAAGGPVLLK